MIIRFILFTFFLLIVGACADNQVTGESSDLPEPVHREKFSAYYWKTVFQLDSAEQNFIRDHNIGRIYLRMFDVVSDNEDSTQPTYPNASVRISWDDSWLINKSFGSLEFVPVVYITLDAMKKMQGNEGNLADKIVTRVSNMCSYHELPGVEELQLDCDWTASTEVSYFRLCDSVRICIKRKELPWRLSSTIRLHQLSRKAPPVDNGVLMVYNTGNFNDPDADNSIIDVKDVEPYLKRLPDYPLHLDVAYPTYSWQLLFRKRRFLGLMNGLEVNDSLKFSKVGDNRFTALRDIPYNGRIIRKGDMVRAEVSDFKDIEKVKKMIDRRMSGHPHSNIIYHLDSKNLSKYGSDEIQKILFCD